MLEPGKVFLEAGRDQGQVSVALQRRWAFLLETRICSMPSFEFGQWLESSGFSARTYTFHPTNPVCGWVLGTV